jgi:hypothetical protein
MYDQASKLSPLSGKVADNVNQTNTGGKRVD